MVLGSGTMYPSKANNSNERKNRYVANLHRFRKNSLQFVN